MVFSGHQVGIYSNSYKIWLRIEKIEANQSELCSYGS